MVVPDALKTRAAIKFCVNLGYTPTETFNMLKVAGTAPELRNLQFLHGMHALRMVEKALKTMIEAAARR